MTLEEVSSGIEREIDVFHLEVDKQSSHKCPECNGWDKLRLFNEQCWEWCLKLRARCKGTGGIKRNKEKTIKVTVQQVETETNLE